MNPSNILLAIKEKKLWIERRERLSRELREVHEENVRISNELSTLKEEISKLDEAYSILSSRSTVSRPSPMGISTIK